MSAKLKICSSFLTFLLIFSSFIILNENVAYAQDSSSTNIETIDSAEFKQLAAARLEYKSVAFNAAESQGVTFDPATTKVFPDPNSTARPIKIVLDAVVKYSDTEDVNIKITSIVRAANGKDEFHIDGNSNYLMKLNNTGNSAIRDMKPNFEPANNAQLVHNLTVEGLGKIVPFHSDTDVNWKWPVFDFFYNGKDEKPYFGTDGRRVEGLDFGVNNPAVAKFYKSSASKLLISDDSSKFWAPNDPDWNVNREDADLYGLIVDTPQSSISYKVIIPLGAYSELDFVRADALPNKVTKWLDKKGNELKPAETGKTFGEQGSFTGYIFDKVVTSADGRSKEYIFVPELTTKWITDDEAPVDLRLSEKGKVTQKAGNFDGYEFVKTVTDKNGNVTHIFKKIVPPPAKPVPAPVKAEPVKAAPQPLAKTGASGSDILVYMSLFSLLGTLVLRTTRKYQN